ncbi:MAG: GTPase ArgK [Acidimicrobiales bacterium]|nr:MAG: methylmalonyl Co-A mutase-associated GTPase MeaB [Actinomycetota bacterium]MBV6508898.1 GTPase ArgK [Acidimicrobiales bacterium]RIK03939.1 MAG: methylmalonyl Co-A mutase-associated GTPase MeaB [Acidobacteriota bacterium]
MARANVAGSPVRRAETIAEAPDPQQLIAAARRGHRPSLARLISIVERGGDDARALGKLTHSLGGDAFTVGITGAPGAGKSTLTSALTRLMRDEDLRVAVLAVDPSSPFSGGAILGDRVRMGDHALDEGVYIRSMATRGHLGGLALATPEAIRVLDAVGKPWVLVETVGVGQMEVEIVGAADSTVVVVNPGWGDSIQANKAGLMEIADIFVVNKADRPGADQTRRDLEQMLDLSASGPWRPPIMMTVASTGEGVDRFWGAIQDHRAHLTRTGELERRRARRLDEELREIVVARLEARVGDLCSSDRYEHIHRDVMDRRLDPWTAADMLLAEG